VRRFSKVVLQTEITVMMTAFDNVLLADTLTENLFLVDTTNRISYNRGLKNALAQIVQTEQFYR
jgi:uncharacterized protein (DUF2164 family)